MMFAPENVHRVDEFAPAIGLERQVQATASPIENLLVRHRKEAYEEGYYRAVNDVLVSLMLRTEAYLQKRPDATQDTHKLIREFEEYIERYVHKLAFGQGWVDGGLGI